MPRAESSDAYLDRVMALAASQARAGRANHAAGANHGGIDPADQTSVPPANHGGADTIDHEGHSGELWPRKYDRPSEGRSGEPWRRKYEIGRASCRERV